MENILNGSSYPLSPMATVDAPVDPIEPMPLCPNMYKKGLSFISVEYDVASVEDGGVVDGVGGIVAMEKE